MEDLYRICLFLVFCFYRNYGTTFEYLNEGWLYGIIAWCFVTQTAEWKRMGEYYITALLGWTENAATPLEGKIGGQKKQKNMTSYDECNRIRILLLTICNIHANSMTLFKQNIWCSAWKTVKACILASGLAASGLNSH